MIVVSDTIRPSMSSSTDDLAVAQVKYEALKALYDMTAFPVVPLLLMDSFLLGALEICHHSSTSAQRVSQVYSVHVRRWGRICYGDDDSTFSNRTC